MPDREQGGAEHHVFGRPIDPALLEEARPPAPKPYPWRALALVLVPLLALALGSVASYLLDGKNPEGDASLRWLLLCTGCGLVVGLFAGAGITRTAGGRAVWALWGVAAPGLLAGLVVGATVAARPLRAWMAERGVERCRAKGRLLCTPRDFREACAKADAKEPGARARAAAVMGGKGEPLCSPEGCTERWVYAGPWQPDDWVAPGSMICSVVFDGEGKGVRHALNPGTEPKE
jgi:hypothetical protein